MTSHVYFEDVAVGQDIPSLIKPVNTVNIAMYIATVWLMDRIHFDHLFSVKRRGLPSIVAPGNMACDYYVQLLNEWVGDKGALRKLSVQFRSFMLPDKTLTCAGKVLATRIEEGRGLVDLELTITNNEGVLCVPGKATVELPLRKDA